MSENISREISQLLLEGKGRKEIFENLKKKEDPERLRFLLNNEALPADKAKFLYVNLLTAFLLVWLTVIKVIDAMALGRFDLYWLASLVVPIIHIYVLRKILRFQKTGHQFLFVLSCLALFRPENRILPIVLILLSLILLTGFLHFKMFPGQIKNEK